MRQNKQSRSIAIIFFSLRIYQSLLPDSQDMSDKRPKLERARSAAEKENQPLQRSGSQLRRQYSQQEPPRRMSTEGVDGGMLLPQRRMQSQNTYYMYRNETTFPSANVECKFVL